MLVFAWNAIYIFLKRILLPSFKWMSKLASKKIRISQLKDLEIYTIWILQRFRIIKRLNKILLCGHKEIRVVNYIQITSLTKRISKRLRLVSFCCGFFYYLWRYRRLIIKEQEITYFKNIIFWEIIENNVQKSIPIKFRNNFFEVRKQK